MTVDGPAGSGKTTLGRALALEIAVPLIDTGLFYRGMMVAARRAGLDVRHSAALPALARATKIEIDTDPESQDPSVVVDGKPAGPDLRDPRNARLLAAISASAAVRAALLEPQRALAAHGAVAVGRDCGTVVFPTAPVKFYLEAPVAVRERRRLAQMRASGGEHDLDLLNAEVTDRDRSDTDRVASPLRAAPDAHWVDTDAMDVVAMVEYALDICRREGLLPASQP